MIDEESMRKRFESLAAALNERQRRLFVASEALAAGGLGAISAVSRATGVCRATIRRGMFELAEADAFESGRQREPGGGRKRSTVKDPTLLADLLSLVEPLERGDPESPLRWTCKSVRKLAAELKTMGHSVGKDTVAKLLREEGFSLQANRKTKEGSSQHEDRDAQFNYINETAKQYMDSGEPVISVDTKKKELLGNFKNSGREWHPKGKPEDVNIHDFIIPGLHRAAPYGIYDINENKGFVSVGIDNDTSAFAVASIARWWETIGKVRYPGAKALFVTADGGGSNGSRVRLWKVELQNMADETGLSISVSHLPPGTSKWNKIEHRLFSFISQNWRGKPLVSHQVIVNLIAATKTTKGLEVVCELDRNEYPKGIKVSDAEMATLNIERDEFHGEWNYTISPRLPQDMEE